MAISKIGSDGLASGSTTPSALSTGAPSWDSSGNLSFNSGYGSVATAYGCRAWVNFNGTGTVAIRASGNVSSITDLGTGRYTVNFSTALPDDNYSCVGNAGSSNGNLVFDADSGGILASGCSIKTINAAGTTGDSPNIHVAIFR